METKKETAAAKADIPNFKLAKVGDRREKKRGGIPLFGGGAGGGGFMGATGGAGLLGGITNVVLKAAILSLITSVGLGAYSFMRKSAAGTGADRMAQPKAFASRAAEKPAFPADMMGKDNKYSAQSGLGMIAGRMDGKTPEQLAAEKAAADAKAAAEAEAAAKAAEGEKTDETAAGPAVPGVDPAAMAAAAAEAEKANGTDKLGKKFGEMSKTLGAGGTGLSGGAGLAGGIGGNFAAPKFAGQSGKALAFGNARSNPGRSTARAGRVPSSRARGLAGRQLDRAVGLSRQAAATGGEGSAALADQAFNQGMDAGSVIEGAGSGPGGSPGGSGTTDAGSTGGPGGQGSPQPLTVADTSPDDCADLFPGQGYIVSAGGGCVKGNVGGKSVDPTDMIFEIIKVLMIIAAIIAALTIIAEVLRDAIYTAGIGQALFQLLGGLMTAVGAMIAIAGLMVVGMGRTAEGGIVAGLGTLMAVCGMVTYFSAPASAAKLTAAQTTTIAVASSLGGLMGAGGAIYSNNVDSREFNNDTQRWE